LITKQILENIEGEASVHFKIKDGLVDFSTISFPHFRGIETILEGKNILDALVITPRVCGICGHAHLMATTRAIEDAYKNMGVDFSLSDKSKKIREFTLIMETIQNHFKWLYMVMMPEIAKLTTNEIPYKPLKGAFASSIASKAIAVFGGQWPHSSYMIPGGITCDPTNIDIIKAQSYVEELIEFFQKESLGIELEKFLSMQTCKEFNELDSDISILERALISADMQNKGFAYDRFLIMGEHNFTKASKVNHTRVFSVDSKYISVVNSYSPREITYAKNALYKDDYYETGSLARMMSISFPMVRNIHRRYKDSAYSRVMARVFEIGYLLNHSLKLLDNISISEDSIISLPDVKNLTSTGIGIVEAPRGPLIHKVEVEQGIIKNYTIITPTQFNIGSSTPTKLTPVQLSMKATTQKEALFIFRTFDVCSVCTTH